MTAVPKSVRLLNGRRMPTVGLGTWQSTNSEEVKNAVRVAIEEGYRHIDTAKAYQNEADIGSVLQELITEGKITRDEMFITTKLWMTGMAPENVRKETLTSLEKLKTDYIDLYLIHFPVALVDTIPKDSPSPLLPMYANGACKTAFIDPLDTWREMEKLVDDGLVKAIGLSNFNKEQLRRIYEQARIKPANIQMECHAWFPQYDLLDFCKTRGISFAAYAPIGSPGKPPTAGRKIPVLMDEPVLQEIASKHNKSVAQVLLRNLLQRGIIVLPKSVTPARIKSNFQVYDFELDSEDIDMVKGINKELQMFHVEALGKQNFSHPFFPWPHLIDS
ncbi:1,5-anhydro-D-fructose reductase-like [Watersipora subatra]|uniref:1,5-anhydro-D-fructose reductase-like n=1 Tax=Watersipora subatra TaxID=2589382 RepID=UPI00355B0A05